MNSIRITILAIAILSFGLIACETEQVNEEERITTTDKTEKQATETDMPAIFPKGQQGPAENFTGTVWNHGLVENDSTYTTVVGNVHFEAGARSNWHSHPAGQILVVVEGVGYHQIEGRPKEIIRKGESVQCPPNVNHWHGASADEAMSHIYIVPNTEKGIVNWGDPVTDEVYNQ